MSSRTNSPLHRYVKGLGPVRQITREQETSLWQRWKFEGDVRARDELVRVSLYQVVRMAARYRGYRLSPLELICEGNFGIVCALQKFDSGRGNRFITCAAYWIRAQMLRFIIRSYSMVSTDSGPLRTQTFFRLRRERARLLGLMGETEAAHEALAQRLNLSSEQVRAFEQRLTNRDASLFDGPERGRPVPLIDILASPGDSPEDAYLARQEQSYLSGVLHASLERLDRRERFVVEASLMCDDDESLSLAEIGRRLGVSRERTRQLESRALKKLRRHVLGKLELGDVDSCSG